MNFKGGGDSTGDTETVRGRVLALGNGSPLQSSGFLSLPLSCAAYTLPPSEIPLTTKLPVYLTPSSQQSIGLYKHNTFISENKVKLLFSLFT